MTFKPAGEIKQISGRLWSPSDFSADPHHVVATISDDGKIIGHSEEILPETDQERWATFDLNNFRQSGVPPEQFEPLLTINTSGEVQGSTGFSIRTETANEDQFFKTLPPDSPLRSMGGWK